MGYSSFVVGMKINRHGQAKVLTQSEIQLVFTHGLNNVGVNIAKVL
jgi:hypothetical protein